MSDELDVRVLRAARSLMAEPCNGIWDALGIAGTKVMLRYEPRA